ncbi:hypothetical protein, partial [Zoogloea sp.]|uniref:hypothetical protein n=1 Tax=Zoogloea sp. TaxID=49181 RepID=UPI0035B2A40D
ACPGTPRGARLAMADARPVFHFTGGERACSVWADTGTPRAVTPADAIAAARAFAPGRPVADVARVERDQWTVYTSYNAHRPLLRVALDDGDGTALYVSSRSGEVVVDTTRAERLWNWIGTVPHWLYFTPLRGDDTGLWRQLVLWLPVPAMLAVLAGLALGLQRLRLRRRYPQGRLTPYRGWKRWHHLLGLGVGGLALSWLVSGWLSNHPFGLLPFSGLPAGAAQKLAGAPFAPSPDLDLLHRQLARLPDAREAEWYRFGGRSYLEVRTPQGLHRLDEQAAPAEPFTLETLAAAIAAIEGQPVASAELIHDADTYHYDRRNRAVFPAARIRLADADETAWYLDPATGRVLARVDRANRLHRWVFNALHRLDFPPLHTLPSLREGLVTGLGLLGTLLAGTGCALGWRRLTARRPAPASRPSGRS